MTSISGAIKASGKTIPELFTPNSDPYGTPYGEWTARWWQWLLSQPKSKNPVTDKKKTDKNALNNKFSSQVWFLAGTIDGFAKRQCIIPRKTSVLCPIINFEISKEEDPTLKNDYDLVSYAKADVDRIAKINVRIDGIDLPDSLKFRIQSGCFDVTLPKDNICGVKAGPTRAAADGFWIFLKPLPVGSHQIQISGSCLEGKINLGTLIDITVR